MRLKYIITIILLCTSGLVKAQFDSPVSISISYFGEMITHPGLKVGLNIRLKQWQKDQDTDALYLSLSLGSFFHKRYQTGLFLMPEINYGRQYAGGSSLSTGLGFGYMRTIVPNTYEYKDAEVRKTKAGHHYFLPGLSLSFGQDLNEENDFANSVLIKPQFLYAFPNFPKGVGYFGLELGTLTNLDQNE